MVRANGRAAEKLLRLTPILQVQCEQYASRTMKKLVISDFKMKQSMTSICNSNNYGFSHVSEVVAALNKVCKLPLLLCCMISGDRYPPPPPLDEHNNGGSKGSSQSDGLENGWACGSCGNVNYPRRQVCNICKSKKQVNNQQRHTRLK